MDVLKVMVLSVLNVLPSPAVVRTSTLTWPVTHARVATPSVKDVLHLVVSSVRMIIMYNLAKHAKTAVIFSEKAARNAVSLNVLRLLPDLLFLVLMPLSAVNCLVRIAAVAKLVSVKSVVMEVNPN